MCQTKYRIQDCAVRYERLEYLTVFVFNYLLDVS